MSDTSNTGSTLTRVLMGCFTFVVLSAAAAVLLFLAAVVGQNQLVGSAPTEVTAEFRGSISADNRSGTLNGEGALLVQQWVAEQSHPSWNPLRILAYNFDYHVVGTYNYPVWITVDPASGYRPNYSLSQSGSGFVWREDGAAFAQVRSARFTAEDLADALEPHVTWRDQ